MSPRSKPLRFWSRFYRPDAFLQSAASWSRSVIYQVLIFNTNLMPRWLVCNFHLFFVRIKCDLLKTSAVRIWLLSVSAGDVIDSVQQGAETDEIAAEAAEAAARKIPVCDCPRRIALHLCSWRYKFEYWTSTLGHLSRWHWKKIIVIIIHHTYSPFRK